MVIQFLFNSCRRYTSTHLFIIAVDYAMKTAISNLAYCGFTLEKAKSRRHPAVYIRDIDYADDIALLSDSVDKAEKLLHNVEIAAKLIDLHINKKKTQYMTFSQNPSKLTTINKKMHKTHKRFSLSRIPDIFQRERR